MNNNDVITGIKYKIKKICLSLLLDCILMGGVGVCSNRSKVMLFVARSRDDSLSPPRLSLLQFLFLLDSLPYRKCHDDLFNKSSLQIIFDFVYKEHLLLRQII